MVYFILLLVVTDRPSRRVSLIIITSQNGRISSSVELLLLIFNVNNNTQLKHKRGLRYLTS